MALQMTITGNKHQQLHTNRFLVYITNFLKKKKKKNFA